MNRTPALALALPAALIAGCAVFSPYDSDFQCGRSRDHGKCTDVAGAYSDALSLPVEGSPAPVAHAQRKADPAGPPPVEPVQAAAPVSRYKAAEYAEMARLIENPVTPVIAPPKLLRTLLVAYATPDKVLYMPRYVYYFVSEGSFVLGDYLNVQRPEAAGVLYPNSSRPGTP